MTKVLVYRVGADPVVEDVDNVLKFAQKSLLNGGYVTTLSYRLSETSVVTFYWDEDGEMKKLPYNRSLPATMSPPAIAPHFVVDTRKGPPEKYAKPGEPGYFHILGNFLVTKHLDGENVDLSQEDITTVSSILELRCAYCKESRLAYAGARFCGAGCSAAHEMKL